MSLGLHRGKYVYTFTDSSGRRIRRSLGTSDKAEAERRLAHIQLTESVVDRSTAKTIEELWTRYYEAKTKEGKDLSRNVRIWKLLSPMFGNLYPSYVSVSKIQEYTASRAVSPATIRTELVTLKSILSWSLKHEYISKKPYIPLPPASPPKLAYITKDQFRRLLTGTDMRHVHLFLLLAISTGARSNALLDLVWDRVDLDKRIIDLRLSTATTSKGRAVVPITDTLHKALTKAKRRATTQYVIEYQSRRVTRIRDSVRIISHRVGLHVTPHMLRHSAAVWMAEGGVPMSEIAQYLGHTNTGITERVYARYSPTYLRKAASHLEI